MNIKLISLAVVLILIPLGGQQIRSQRGEIRTGGHNTVFGDIKVHETANGNAKPLTLDILLYTEAGNLVSRQTVQSNGRYRFTNLTEGRYQVVVEVENSEVARFPIDLSSPFKNEIQQDLEFELRGSSHPAVGVVSAPDNYHRPAKNASLFDRAS